MWKVPVLFWCRFRNSESALAVLVVEPVRKICADCEGFLEAWTYTGYGKLTSFFEYEMPYEKGS
jgi:hypothetical protein